MPANKIYSLVMGQGLYIIPVLLFSVVIHEMAHGWMALRLGDPTAREMGRLTFNPIPHIDPVGSIIVPLFSLLVAGRVFIAWAKPVPVNPYNFSNFRRDDMLVSLVGPLSNLVTALACSMAAIVFGVTSPLVARLNVGLLTELWKFLLMMFFGGVYLNVTLAVFNLIPVPPLDGSHVLATVLPDDLADRYRRVGFLGIFLLLFLLRLPAFNAFFGAVIGVVASPYDFFMAHFLSGVVSF
jgi:Zn-dependent protease